MIWFFIFLFVIFTFAIIVMAQKRKSPMEFRILIIVMLLGFADWISILMGQPFNLNYWIATLIDRIVK